MRVSGLPRIATMLAAALSAAAPLASAQNSRWADPYRNGVKAFEAGRCGEAVPLLERAVSVDPKAQSNKLIEGVFRTDYFPYYYLALCYVDLQQWDKASQNLDKARPTLTRQQQVKFTEAETKIKTALNVPKADPRKAAFDAAVAQAEGALASKQYAQALRQLDQIRGGYAAEYASAGLSAKRDEAARALSTQLYDEGRAAAQSARYAEARAKFQQADQTLPNQKPIVDALADLRRRDEEYQRLKSAAIADQNAKSYDSARDKLEQARTQQAELFQSDNLGARLTEVTALAIAARRGGTPSSTTTGAGAASGAVSVAGGRGTTTPPAVDPKIAESQRLARSARDYVAQGKYAEADAAYASALAADPKNGEAAEAIAKGRKFRELRDRGRELSRSKNTAAARQALAEARTLDADRFAREGLASLLTPVWPPAPDPARAALQQGLAALFSGRPQESIAIFEPAVARASASAPLHAYLGVAYAMQALSTPNADDRSRLQARAVEQFREAKAAQADYQLSARVVSPSIVSMYESARQ
jgi:tetratricopeptide (TPR) repeat protein